MQTITVTKDFLTGKDCSTEVLHDIATRHCKFTEEQVAKYGKQGKLLHFVNKFLADPNNGYAEMYKDGTLQLDIAALPDPVAPKQVTGQRRASAKPLTGAYRVVNKNGLKCTPESDPGKWKIWEQVFNNTTFEQYFAKAPQKSLTRTNRIITAGSEMRWALKCGWVVPVEAAPQQQPEQPAEQQPAEQQ